MLQFDGVLIVKNDTQIISEKFAKREFVLEDEGNDGKYKQSVQFQLSQDKCDFLDQYNIGDRVIAHFNLRGRSWTNPQGETKYFNSLDVWKIEIVSKGGQAPQIKQPPKPKHIEEDEEEINLPF
tara:strand:+ start:90 stop:461 length:372 start_codon:yes stop_codon:yes gene_type:complete